ncbi:MoxR family ATPase [Pollutibacter soli]|uniref:AAA family ATPase n=1 Tax=Pollutibacter soli TaxID=3034157 RepID=UPI003013EFD3
MIEQQDEPVFESRTDLSVLFEAVNKIKQEVGKIIVGQTQMIDQLIAAILSNGHVLIEGVPGVAKTLTAKLLARSLEIPFSRIQFTPDLMPSDVLGTTIFNPRDSGFEFRPGPIFSGIVLIDEINRSPAKTQAALFEVMEERQATVDGKTHPMHLPFMVVATQNPVEHEGTYRLPEAQLDRFLFKINVPYPNLEEEVGILKGHHEMQHGTQLDQIQPVLNRDQILFLQQQIRMLHVEEKLLRFIAGLITSTRNNKAIYLGASPRATIAVLNASKAMAAMHGRDFVTPDDIISVLPPVLRHRIILTPEKEMEGVTTDDVIKLMIQSAEIPR